MATDQSTKLAVDGGSPHIPEKLPGWPWFNDAAIEAATGPLKSGRVNYWTGDIGKQFEDEWAGWCGAKYAITTTNGTSALHTAVAALGIGPGDEVITPSYTFIASSFCIVQAGAIPVFADCKLEDHCLDAADVERKITPRTRAIIVVHLYGIVADMEPILDVARRNNLKVIEDCAQAHGATWRGKKVGTIGDIGAFSFCQSKHITTGGEGGAVITDDEQLAWDCRSFRDHGYDVQARISLLELEGIKPYIHKRVGYNYRMTEMQSALGLAQLPNFESWNIARRRANGKVLIARLKDCPQIEWIPQFTDEKNHSFFVFPIALNLDRLKCDKKTFLKALEAEGAPVWREFWPQCYQEEAYQQHGGFGSAHFPFKSSEYTSPDSVRYNEVYCKNSAYLEERTFIAQCHPRLDPEHMELIAEAILKVARYYAK